MVHQKVYTVKTVCCGKKRNIKFCFYYDGCDGGVWKCIKGYGCNKHAK